MRNYPLLSFISQLGSTWLLGGINMHFALDAFAIYPYTLLTPEGEGTAWRCVSVCVPVPTVCGCYGVYSAVLSASVLVR